MNMAGGEGTPVGEEKELCVITRPLGGSWVHGTVFDVQKREETLRKSTGLWASVTRGLRECTVRPNKRIPSGSFKERG